MAVVQQQPIPGPHGGVQQRLRARPLALAQAHGVQAVRAALGGGHALDGGAGVGAGRGDEDQRGGGGGVGEQLRQGWRRGLRELGAQRVGDVAARGSGAVEVGSEGSVMAWCRGQG